MFSVVVLVFIAAELSGSVARVRRPDALIKWGWQPRSVMRVGSAQGNCTGSHSWHPVTLPVGQRTCTGQAGARRPGFRLRGARRRHLCLHPGTAGGDG
jgi:hypothetical protein